MALYKSFQVLTSFLFKDQKKVSLYLQKSNYFQININNCHFNIFIYDLYKKHTPYNFLLKKNIFSNK